MDSSSVLKRGRGFVRLDSYELWPQTRGGGIAPLYARQLWKHICRMLEIEKRPYGQVVVRVWKNAQSAFEFLRDEDYYEACFLLHGRCCASSASRLKNLFENGIAQQQSFAKRARIKDWKCKLQNSVRAQHAWIKKQSRCAPDMCFRGLDGKRTANVHEQFRAVRHAWSAVTDIFRDGEPDHDVFFQQYGHFIPTVDVDLPAITGDILRQAIASMPLSSPGLDAWKVGDLRLLVLYAPWVFDSLAVLLSDVERTGRWPVSTICGYTTLIPKGDEAPEGPLDLRPITVLSAIYRLWARVRCRQLAAVWQEAWSHPGIWGGRKGRGPEPLLLEICLDMELTADDSKVASLSFDLSKAFDRVPRDLLGKILGRMSMPTCVLAPYMDMLRHATRRYKIGVCLDLEHQIWGGILQGCPVSILAMNAVVNIWLLATSSAVPSCFPRSYVDDVSVTASAEDADSLRATLKVAYTVADRFTTSIGGQLNKRKSFSFGDACVAGNIHPDLAHSDAFRLVGGSIVCRQPGNYVPTALEVARLSKWASTGKASRHLPISWEERCAVLLRTRSQATWGAGTHKLCVTRSHERYLVSVRAGVMRCLLRRDQYNASPAMCFGLLASPSLNPFFRRVVDGLQVVWRVLSATGRFQEIMTHYRQLAGNTSDGPVARLQEVNEMPGFRGVIDDMFTCGLHDKAAWLHRVRDVWRLEEFRRVARDRPDFRGIEQGILRDATLKYLWQLQKDAHSCPGAVVTFLQEEARMKASVLRLLLTGGLFTQDVVTRHKQSCNTLCECALGGVANITHVSWERSHYSAYRHPLLFLSLRLQRACPCFLYAAILTESNRDLIPHIVLVQSVLVDIWRAHIKKYLYNDLGPDPPQPNPATSSSVPAVASAGVASDAGASSSCPSGITENGHFISGAVGGGVFCRKCGKFVREPAHRRLKISYKKCEQSELPQHFWTDVPNYDHNPHRLLGIFTTFLNSSNGHDLCWNGLISRPGGRISCFTCTTVFCLEFSL